MANKGRVPLPGGSLYPSAEALKSSLIGTFLFLIPLLRFRVSLAVVDGGEGNGISRTIQLCDH